METSLHRRLKEMYGIETGGRCEVAVAGFRIDALDGDGTLIEIQSGALGPLKPKLGCLLPEHRLLVVKPVVLRRAVVRRTTPDGADLSRRASPKRGCLLDVFDDLVGLAAHIADPNLSLEFLGVAIEEVRIPRRRRPGFAVVDRRLSTVLEVLRVSEPVDLWGLLPVGLSGGEAFTTAELAHKLGRSLSFAQRVACCLRLAGAVRTLGKRGNARIYQAADEIAAKA